MNIQIEAKVRPIIAKDIKALKTVVETNDLFPPNMLDDMLSDYLSNKNSSDLWFTYQEDRPVAIAYCAPERMTEGTWNLYLIAVHPDFQGRGIGTSIVNYIEQMLAKRGARILLVETSSLLSFTLTQKFYLKCGYEQEARIREFYQAGEDKIVFRKSLI